MPRLLLIVLLLVGVSAIPFFIWGAGIEATLSQKGAAGFMREFGDWAWLAGLGLIASDIALPVPARKSVV